MNLFIPNLVILHVDEDLNTKNNTHDPMWEDQWPLFLFRRDMDDYYRLFFGDSSDYRLGPNLRIHFYLQYDITACEDILDTSLWLKS